jgi:hypothetical protein
MGFELVKKGIKMYVALLIAQNCTQETGQDNWHNDYVTGSTNDELRFAISGTGKRSYLGPIKPHISLHKEGYFCEVN